MSWGRRALLAALVMGWHGISWAQTGCVPNPNLAGPPFVDGCTIPASALNRGFGPLNQNGAAFAPTISFTGDATNANKLVLGSSTLPNATQNPILAIEKFSNSTATAGVNQTVYIGSIKSGNTSLSRLTGLFSETQDISGWSGGGSNNFIEGIRSHASLVPPGTLGSAYGLVTVAEESGAATHTFMIGTESEVITRDADAPAIFSPLRYSASFVSSSSGSKKVDAAFIVNPFLGTGTGAGTYRRGFYVPTATGLASTVVTDSAFEASCNCAIGLQLSGMPTSSFASLDLPNTAPVRIKNGASSADVNVLSLSNVDILSIAGDANVAAVAIGQPGTSTAILGALKLAKVTAAGLPGCNVGLEGILYAVSDANSATFNAPVVGGGGNHVMAYCNGSGWTVH